VFKAFCGGFIAIGEDGADLIFDRVGVEGGDLPVPDELLGRVILKRSNSAATGEFAQLNINSNVWSS
jgi:hypothetical protein